jgi:hypothetical protein
MCVPLEPLNAVKAAGEMTRRSKGGQLVFFNFLELHNTSPGSGDP